MAEAAEEPQHRFFCHCCKSETNPKLPDFVCPRCDSGFIEEVAEDSSLLQNSTSAASEDSNSLFSELWQLLFMERSALLSHPPSSESHSDDSEQVSAGQSQSPPVSSGSVEAGEPESSSPPEQERSSRPEQRPAVEGSSMLQLYSNPGDYAWGQGGLDAVITELLGQLESTGPPPAEKDMISSLPTVCISQEQTDSRLECPVCREEYSLGESVRKLPCLHYFHSHCIVPWLELHDTCPVCRKSLDGVDNSLPPTSEPPEDRSIRTEQQERQAI
ncbi:E3 ubiquitin-protein ligase RNF115-like isoform X2 [Seriola dumerili]|uniref:E3 ubiquitin-protein ligase RNF115-like isoform X2 n=1 Tax=Seriola dumerili TaxID=41447 RepID=UPI000BBED1C3|nr:E3 ubiquitin-protein ligase RNF115-like isoform X2 [Seriola dumerili]